MKFLTDLDINGKTLLIRGDYNVPIKDGVIQDDNRIRQSIPTVEYALEKGAALILSSHLGKPKGQVMPEFTLLPVAKRISELIGREVRMAPDCVGEDVERLAKELRPGEVLLLENLRFHPQEQANDPDFSRQLAGLADIYVDDAFGLAHRSHASNVGVTEFAKECCAGLLLKKEWEYLGEALAEPKRPYVAISGGAKVSSKLGILYRLLDKVDEIIIGGAMANTFVLAQGHETGRSLVEKDLVDEARSIMTTAEAKGVKLHLPVDFTLGNGPEDEVASGVCPANAIPADKMVLDIGPESAEKFRKVIEGAKTIMWNGPMGLFENPAFADGSMSLAECIAKMPDVLSIVGGGDTDAVIHKAGLEDGFSFISTGGGSFLEFLEGKELPAFKALKEFAAK